MKCTFFDEYTRSFDEKDVLRQLKMPEDHAFGASIAALLAKTDAIARPKHFFFECEIEDMTENTVTFGGETFRSSRLVKKLQGLKTVYPYASTCGTELAEFAKTITDTMDQYAFDAVMECYRRQIDAIGNKAVGELLPEGKSVSSSNPGSLITWPIQEQEPLFRLFGDAAEKAGITLTESFLMFPVKTTAGIRFESDGTQHDCALCQKENCPNRKAAFDMKAYMEAKDEDME